MEGGTNMSEMRNRRTTYNYGNTARQMEPLRREPERRRPERRPKGKQRTQVDQQTNRNRQRQEVMDMSYVIFLTVIAVVLGAAIMVYLSLETSNASRSSNVADLQIELSDLTMENDTALATIENSVDLNTIKTKAERLGMVYITSSQIYQYQSPTADYVIQYEEIPESGVLPQSYSIAE